VGKHTSGMSTKRGIAFDLTRRDILERLNPSIAIGTLMED